MKYTKILFMAGAVTLISIALEATDTTVRDAQGRVVGTETQMGGTTYYRDSQGRTQGSETTSGNVSYCRDAQGRMIGTKTVQGNQVVYRDAQGRLVKTETTNGNTTTIQDAQGRIIGTMTRDSSGTTTFRFHGPFHSIHSHINTSAIFINIPTTAICTFFCINSQHNTLTAKFICCFT